MSPIANAYLREGDLHRMEPFFPLRVYVCEHCLLVQLPETQTPAQLFGEEYLYFSSYSESWLRHAEALAEASIARFGLDPTSLVVELASNDGYLLQYFQARGIPVLGVEPAPNVARVAVEERGIPTECAFFGRAVAERLRERGRPADLIVGNNVLAHVPDLHDFIEGIRVSLSPRGVVSLEFPHLLELMDQNQFDTIYHEHFSYFSFLTAREALARHDLAVFDVERLPTHGGSLRVFARHAADESRPATARVAELLEEENRRGLHAVEGYAGFRARVEDIKCDLLELLIRARREGKRVVGYGAAAKGNTLLNFCGIRSDLLDFVVDRSPHKQGRFLPGTHLPIRGPEAIDEARPDYVLILPWNLRDEVKGQLARIETWGGRFVVPIPRVEVIA